ncbi:MAG: Calx-beta domain-containing protein, partial [Myxococcota bacterium]
SFFVELSNPTGGARLGTATATVAVVDAGAGDVSYMGRSTVLESAADFTLTFERSGEAYGPLTLSYRVVGGTAQADTDVADSAGTVGWDADETGTREARIALVDDNEDEPDETLVFRFEVSDPTAVLSVAEATVTVLDDDDGCACSSVHKGRRGSVWAVFLVLGLLFARRRNR